MALQPGLGGPTTFHLLGAGLLNCRPALLRAVQAGDIIGCRAVLVHAKDDPAREFYIRFGFEPSPTDPFRLFLLLKDIKASLGISSGKQKT